MSAARNPVAVPSEYYHVTLAAYAAAPPRRRTTSPPARYSCVAPPPTRTTDGLPRPPRSRRLPGDDNDDDDDDATDGVEAEDARCPRRAARHSPIGSPIGSPPAHQRPPRISRSIAAGSSSSARSASPIRNASQVVFEPSPKDCTKRIWGRVPRAVPTSAGIPAFRHAGRQDNGESVERDEREARSSCRRGAMVAVTQAIVVLVAAAYDRL